MTRLPELIPEEALTRAYARLADDEEGQTTAQIVAMAHLHKGGAQFVGDQVADAIVAAYAERAQAETEHDGPIAVQAERIVALGVAHGLAIGAMAARETDRLSASTAGAAAPSLADWLSERSDRCLIASPQSLLDGFAVSLVQGPEGDREDVSHQHGTTLGDALDRAVSAARGEPDTEDPAGPLTLGRETTLVLFALGTTDEPRTPTEIAGAVHRVSGDELDVHRMATALDMLLAADLVAAGPEPLTFVATPLGRQMVQQGPDADQEPNPA